MITFLWHRQRIRAIGVLCMVGTTLTPNAIVAQSSNASPPHVLTLSEVLDRAMADHPAVKAADAQAAATRGDRTTARAFGNPMLSYDVENAPFPGGSPVIGMNRETMATATLPLESIFQRGPRARRADADVRAAAFDARGTRQQVALDAARAYFRTALAQVSVDAARDLSAWMDSVVAYNRTRVEQGVTAEADLIRAELERDRAQVAVTLEEAELARARSQLASFLGDDAQSAPTLLVAVDDTAMQLPPMNPLDASLARRPDIRAGRERLTSAQASVASERSMVLRTLDATIGTKWSAGSTSMVAGLSVPLPVFDPNRGQIARAGALRDAAAFELASRERNARADLGGATDAAQLLTERVTQLTRATAGRPSLLARADEARRIALGAYREGAVSLLQVIDAARASGEARVTFYQIVYAQHESVAMLLAARGDDVAVELSRLAERPGSAPSRK